MSKNIVIVGMGGHGKVVASIVRDLDYNIVGYVDIKDGGKIDDINYIGTDSELKEIKTKYNCTCAAIGVGHLYDASLRMKIYAKIKDAGYNLPVLASPFSKVDKFTNIGEGTVVMPGAVINTGTKIGKCGIINTCASIDHDCIIEDFVHISPNATLCGSVFVGYNAHVGAGATVKQCIKISRETVVGLNAAVVKNCDSNSIYFGVPAIKIKSMQEFLEEKRNV
jgi:sugar O-acyltransferase (sialic acid O-acetyltransferase NeuD family)